MGAWIRKDGRCDRDLRRRRAQTVGDCLGVGLGAMRTDWEAAVVRSGSAMAKTMGGAGWEETGVDGNRERGDICSFGGGR